jgi:hypothetical protein
MPTVIVLFVMPGALAVGAPPDPDVPAGTVPPAGAVALGAVDELLALLELLPQPNVNSNAVSVASVMTMRGLRLTVVFPPKYELSASFQKQRALVADANMTSLGGYYVTRGLA